LTQQHEEKNVRSLAESAIFYVGIPVALLYPLGVLGVGIQLWRDPLFPYTRLDTVWTAVSLVADRVVIGTGIRLLCFGLISTAFGIGVSVLVVRGLLLLGREPAEASAVGKGGPRRWMLYLLLLMPLSVVVLWNSVRVSNATELAYFVGFFVFSAAAGLVIGYARWMSAESSYYLSVLAAYLGGRRRGDLPGRLADASASARGDKGRQERDARVQGGTGQEHVRDARQGGLVLVPLQQERLAQPTGGRRGDRAFQGMPGLPGQGLIPKRRH
jgi:hypothetical protein